MMPLFSRKGHNSQSVHLECCCINMPIPTGQYMRSLLENITEPSRYPMAPILPCYFSKKRQTLERSSQTWMQSMQIMEDLNVISKNNNPRQHCPGCPIPKSVFSDKLVRRDQEINYSAHRKGRCCCIVYCRGLVCLLRAHKCQRRKRIR